MIQTLELIKHFVLGIVSTIIFIHITMAETNTTKNFIEIVDRVKKTYPEDSLESRIPTSLITTIAIAETGNFKFKGAPTAEQANNFFGIKPVGDQPFLTTSGGANLRQFEDSEDSIRGFINLVSTSPIYEKFRDSIEKSEPLSKNFQTLTPYSENENYPGVLSSVYNTRVKPMMQTNRMIPESKPIDQQMQGIMGSGTNY